MTENPVRIGLIGTGRIGRSHGEILARHTPGAELIAVADPNQAGAQELAQKLGTQNVYAEPGQMLARGDVDAVVIAAPSTLHSSLIRQAAAAGKAVFSEKPASMSIEEIDAVISAADASKIPLQIGFNRRFAPGFAAARAAIDAGTLGEVQLLRSNTRDPGLTDPSVVPPWTIFTQTLIHDFDTLNWLNPGAEPIRVYAQADALVRPDFKDKGLLDTALVTIAYSNGALAMADASFQAVYGYDVRGEVFGSGGMVTAGHSRTTDATSYTAAGIAVETSRADTDLLQGSYRAEFASFVDYVKTGQRGAAAGGRDARQALRIALACIDSMKSGQPVAL